MSHGGLGAALGAGCLAAEAIEPPVEGAALNQMRLVSDIAERCCCLAILVQ